MRKKIYFILFFTFVVIIVMAFFYQRLRIKEEKTNQTTKDEVLLEKIEGWGPCPPETICRQETKLYYSGRLVMEGQVSSEKQLPKDIIEEIIKVIGTTEIMNKDCNAPLVLDYMATYKIFFSGKEKVIQFPGCEKEIMEFEKLIPKSDETFKGGA